MLLKFKLFDNNFHNMLAPNNIEKLDLKYYHLIFIFV